MSYERIWKLLNEQKRIDRFYEIVDQIAETAHNYLDDAIKAFEELEKKAEPVKPEPVKPESAKPESVKTKEPELKGFTKPTSIARMSSFVPEGFINYKQILENQYEFTFDVVGFDKKDLIVKFNDETGVLTVKSLGNNEYTNKTISWEYKLFNEKKRVKNVSATVKKGILIVNIELVVGNPSERRIEID